jgi:GTP-binding protein
MDVDTDFTEAVRREVEIALEASDVVLFLVDGQAGLTLTDRELAGRLRRASKPVVLVVNKIDHERHQRMSEEFWQLGFEPVIAVSAEHDLGVGGLLDRLSALLPSESIFEALPPPSLKMAILGRPNVGKSSIANAILQDARTLVSPISGTTRDAVDIPYQRGAQHYTLIDTAGIRPKGKRSDSVEIFSVMRSEKSLDRADLCVLVLDVAQGVTSQDKRIAGLIAEAHKPCVVALNKWDLIEERTGDKEGLREVLEQVQSELFFISYAPLVLVSAKTGRSVDRLFKRVENVREASRRRIGTGVLNRLVEEIVASHPPGLSAGRRFKILYATQPEAPPGLAVPVPELVLFCNDGKLLEDSYRRFFESRIRQQEPWVGLPLRIRLRDRVQRDAPRKQDENSASGRENRR